jgi:thiamine pyrophosphate-dependent acetolactate synthase large subunit-like protein
MDWRATMEVVAKCRTSEPVIVSPGTSGAVLYTVSHRDPVLYNSGLSYASPYAFGIALKRPGTKVIAIEGDGSMLAGLGHLTTIARYAPPNLVVLAIDNGTYCTGDASLRGATSFGVDLAAIARGAGIGFAVAVADLAAFEEHLRRALAEAGPAIIVCKVDTHIDRRALKPYTLDRVEQGMEFRRQLARTMR